MRPNPLRLCSLLLPASFGVGCLSNPTVPDVRATAPVAVYDSAATTVAVAACIGASWQDHFVLGRLHIDLDHEGEEHVISARLDGKLAHVAVVRPHDAGSVVEVHQHNVLSIGWNAYVDDAAACAEAPATVSQR
jgi:hypothetical protein